MKKTLLLLAGLLISSQALAETITQQSGWAGWNGSFKFSEHWGSLSDVQIRSGDNWADTQNLMFRPGLTYFINSRSNFTVGYLWNGTLNTPGHDLVEHRIWQQYIYTQQLGSVPLTHRLRLEQRFIEQASGGDRRFAQRLRYFARSVIPLGHPDGAFTRGPFIGLQNEIFFNVQHRDAVNGAFFDQNRAYLAGGYRLSKQIDLELGYLNQYINGRVNDTLNHVVQFALYTRF
ncbi:MULTISPECIES: DUF2490 domain-containing protein [Hydrocarboniphaga]|jgi:hypothetical protein|uniref:DUF2490 domain-containing protein n=2 Tax=Gammaproteobacteria TaxID=1236 RepID=I7ZDD1_9GAMM|nr:MULTISPECIES: DUF2490 domain-containing protein [Hydrocarboniphaga]EIT69702.1 hypothetical protein WQQ_32840 [Hydrocarboniphaga effusa AP103]MDZ4080959.1 DUF2490 domain-containing protein [Hydrocarboniphaga sp.]